MAGITHEWNGTVLTITSDSGSSSCDLKGATGDTGIRGPQGPKGEKGSAIDSVNGKIGDVVLTYEDVGALPDTYIPPVTKVNSKTGEVTLTYEDVGALPNTYVAPVTSVNTKTGAVQLTYSDVNAAAANHTHTAADVGALAAGGTAADSSKLGGKSANEYALKTDTAPDSSKLGGKAPEYYIQPRNLLDNSDFRNPVNQRAYTTYNTIGYTIDRWLMYYSDWANFTLENGLVFKVSSTGCSFYQRIAAKSVTVGAKYTLAYMMDGDVYVQEFVFETAENESYDVAFIVPEGTHTLLWAALYEGSYTVDTLPEYQPKDISQERIACQRFFTRADAWRPIYGYASWDGEISLFLPTPTEMRISPTATTLKGTLYINGSFINIDETPANALKTTQGLQILLRTKTPENSKHNCTLNLAETAAYFSADL